MKKYKAIILVACLGVVFLSPIFAFAISVSPSSVITGGIEGGLGDANPTCTLGGGYYYLYNPNGTQYRQHSCSTPKSFLFTAINYFGSEELGNYTFIEQTLSGECTGQTLGYCKNNSLGWTNLLVNPIPPAPPVSQFAGLPSNMFSGVTGALVTNIPIVLGMVATLISIKFIVRYVRKQTGQKQ